MATVRYPSLYQINTRVWLTDLSQKLGRSATLDDIPDDELDRLESEGRVVFRYTRRDGRRDDAANPNGSARAIAGVCNRQRNVVGLMPHPERASESVLGSADGRIVFEALARALQAV